MPIEKKTPENKVEAAQPAAPAPEPTLIPAKTEAVVMPENPGTISSEIKKPSKGLAPLTGMARVEAAVRASTPPNFVDEGRYLAERWEEYCKAAGEIGDWGGVPTGRQRAFRLVLLRVMQDARRLS